jgi:hypothetical protein
LTHIGRAVALTTALVVATPAVSAERASVPFMVGGVPFELPAQPGYCLPTGQVAAVTQLVAAADKANVTDVTLVRCGEDAEAALQDYTLIKTPVTALLVTMSREQVLATLAAEFDKPEFKEFVSKQVVPQTENNSTT